MVGATFAGLIALSPPSRAEQSAAALIPIITPLRGDDLFASQHGPTVTAAFTPLRLQLTGGLFSQASAFSGCDRLSSTARSFSILLISCSRDAATARSKNPEEVR